MKGTQGKKRFFPALTWGQATFIVFVAAAGFFLWTEHRAHVLGALPWLIFLLCPLMHFFMHKGHGRHDTDETTRKHRNEQS